MTTMGQARTMGRIKRTLTVCGRKYTLTAPGIGQLYADLEAYIISRRSDPLEAVARAIAAGKIPESQQDRAWRIAMEQATRMGAVSQAEMTEFENSPRGLAYKLWACLQAEHAAEFPDPESVLRLVEKAVEEAAARHPDNPEAATAELARLMQVTAVATGEADAGNSSGPTRAGRAEPEAAAPGGENDRAGRPKSSGGPSSSGS